ncbi:galactose-specific lectin nattectin isoform X2 [Labeo rohita]|uniref:galactose-specific lectin nattectin isoform X2 n=1 Tax=Labeo rohita TaxID=84645 RepID=UPI0021E2B4ED|nr:galactose-specific lectin nattectin isoform X2 [Labeo rohita]
MGLWTVCVSLCLLFALNASACQSGWAQFGYRCFKAFNYDTSWSDAEMTCLNYGGNLASVHSQTEYNFLRVLIYSDKSFWIGGYDAVSEGKWFWSDGTKMNFRLWSPIEPNNEGGIENCIEMNFRATGLWNDLDCNIKRPFVCATSG